MLKQNNVLKQRNNPDQVTRLEMNHEGALFIQDYHIATSEVPNTLVIGQSMHLNIARCSKVSTLHASEENVLDYSAKP